jgi:hypothetical protein
LASVPSRAICFIESQPLRRPSFWPDSAVGIAGEPAPNDLSMKQARPTAPSLRMGLVPALERSSDEIFEPLERGINQGGRNFNVVFACRYRAPGNVTPEIENEFNRTFKIVRLCPVTCRGGDHRRLALGVEGAVGAAPDFRVNNRIFATLHTTSVW